MLDIPLSVLDLAPIVSGGSAAEALRATADLARHAETLGYTRFWVGEHHNTAGSASSAPAVLLAHLAATTDTIRIGSGGVMLPNHPPLVVAEQFGTLEALHPGRIDLGIGRAPGTDEVTAQALRRQAATPFPDELAELVDLFTGRRAGELVARPGLGDIPELWLLGSSEFSARLAAKLGVPFAFAYHINASGARAALSAYRRSFQPSRWRATPYTMMSVTTVCAGTDDEAETLAAPTILWLLRSRQGRQVALPTPGQAATQSYTDAEREFVQQRLADQAVGSPATVGRKLQELLNGTGVDELMLTSMVSDLADRTRSLDLVMNYISANFSSSLMAASTR